MAFPEISADTTNGTVTSNSASWTLTYPANIAADDLLLGFIASDGIGAPGGGDISGWNVFVQSQSSGSVTIAAFAKRAIGTESGTFSVAMNAAEQGGWRVFRIPASTWFKGSLPADNANSDSDSIEQEASAGATSTPNPPNLDPGNWATEDTLWVAAVAIDTSRTISVFPLADHQSADVSGGAGGATLGLCTANDAVGSKDPGTFTISTSDDWTCLTVAVRPAAAGSSFLPPRRGRDPYGNLLRSLAHRPWQRRPSGIFVPDSGIFVPA